MYYTRSRCINKCYATFYICIFKFGSFERNGVKILLANQSNAYLDGVVEDVLVKVNGLIFFVDFYILYMEDSTSSINPVLILLGRSFLKITKIKIDVDNGTLTIEFDNKIAKFNVFEETKKS